MLKVIPAPVYLLLLLLPLSLLAASDKAENPNILILLADDLGYNDSGLYRDVYQQVPVARMPALESLAEEGIRFSRFYTESTCSASRVALLTGQYPARQGFIPIARGISADVLTLPEYLQSRGYVTHHVGKWHAGEINPAAFPAAQGFNTSFGFLSQWMLQGPDARGKPRLKAPTYRNPWLQDEKGKVRQYQGHLEDILTAQTLKLIQQKKTKPWFIYHAFLAPHAPLEPSVAFAKTFPDTAEGKYLAMLAQLDHNLEQIFSALKASGQWDNTIIIFASDNGSQEKHSNSNAPFAGGKAAYDEGGIRAPLVIKWNSTLASGNPLRRDPVSIMDIYASLQAVIGKTDAETTLDGRASLLPDSKQEKTPSLNVFYSFDALSIFDNSGKKRLIQEWNAEKVTRNELLYYDEQGLLSVPKRFFWQNWFFDKDTENENQFADFIQWRDRVRQVPVKVEAGENSTNYKISGSDFLRTPVNPSYAVAFSFTPDDVNKKQVLLEQEGIMEVVFERGTLFASVHGMKVKAEGFVMGQFYRVVLSGEFYDQYSNVRETTLPSRLHLVVNGELKDSAESAIESLADVNIQIPHITRGIGTPQFSTTQLLPNP